MISYFDYSSTTYRKPKQVYKAIKTYKKYGVNNLKNGVEFYFDIDKSKNK